MGLDDLFESDQSPFMNKQDYKESVKQDKNRIAIKGNLCERCRSLRAN